MTNYDFIAIIVMIGIVGIAVVIHAALLHGELMQKLDALSRKDRL
jgi:hypothetical protein